jgi:cytochrome P450
VKSANVHVGLPPSPAIPGPLQTALLWRWPFAFLEALRDRYGQRFTVRALGRPPLVFLADPSDAKAVFSASPDALCPGEGGAAIQPIVGTRSFMLADGDEHWQGRTLLTSSFSEGATRAHTAMVRDVAEKEIASWPRGTPIALHDHLRALTLRVILNTLFGDLAEGPVLHERLLSMLSMTAGTGLTLPVTRVVPPGRTTWHRFVRDRQAVDAMLLAMIERRKAAPNGDHEVLGLLLAARRPDGSPLSHRHIRDSLMSLILAGHGPLQLSCPGRFNCWLTATARVMSLSARSTAAPPIAISPRRYGRCFAIDPFSCSRFRGQ